MLLPNIHGEFFAQVTRGLDRRANRHGHHLLVSNSHTDESEAESVIHSLLGRVDGLIILWPRVTTDFLESIVPESLPVVLLNTSVESSRFSSLSFDNRSGGYAAVQHLAEHGHERVAIFTGGAENFDSQERLAGYRLAVDNLGLMADSSLEIEGDFTREGGQALIKERFLSLEPRPTALFASNDSMAVGALRGLHEAGLQVPEDVALVGFDDIPTAKYVTPPLTTVHAPTQELGEQAMGLLLARLQGEPSPLHRTLKANLAVRESCGCVSSE
ncbi:LacI family transcriptional regulator [Salinibacter ruber]|uniref:LacI family DNA-binding transcriptional regulator n=1 Tax=Salinibacter ruber TaxID=146919 RepID=UPI002167A179|nr:LacI family transcriptional regulator [Salinibacter ruber]